MTTGLIQVPPGVDPGDFIVSGGTLKAAARPRRRCRPLAALIDDYLANQAHKAPSTVYTEGVHLRNLAKKLGDQAEAPADRIAQRDLEQYLQARLKERSPSTVDKERTTIIQLFRWAVAQGDLDVLTGGRTSPSSRGTWTCPRSAPTAEIEDIIARGGLASPTCCSRAWDCLYLNPAEIAGLLRTVRERADTDFGYLLHAIPAYTGMRRGEVLRLRWSDVEFDQGHIIARSRKQSRRRVETTRRIDLHPELGRELRAWRERRPGGQYVVCEAEEHGAPRPRPGQPRLLAADAGDDLVPQEQEELVQGRLPHLPALVRVQPGRTGRRPEDHRRVDGPPDRGDEEAISPPAPERSAHGDRELLARSGCRVA